MKTLLLIFATFVSGMNHVSAFDVSLLYNNKEAFSRELSKEEKIEAETWGNRHALGNELLTASKTALKETFDEMERVDTSCEIGLIRRLKDDAVKHGILNPKNDIIPFIKYLRVKNLIDDVLYRMMRETYLVMEDFRLNAKLKAGARPLNLNTPQNAGMNLPKFYADFKQWPDDIETCTFETYWDMISGLKWKDSKDLNTQMLKLNWMAYKDGHISLEAFNRFETIRKRKVTEWPVFFNRYADVVNNAKDKMAKVKETATKNDFTVEYVTKRDGLTQRGNLYRTYNSTQIILLTQILERTAKRMDARQATINWQYTDDPNGEREVYVLSPMEQYRAAIKMLRKDMAEVMRSEAFAGTGLSFEHIVAAGFESGYVKSSELDLILKFEDFWNPKTPKWKAYANFAFSIGGSATLFLPPPWNIVGAVALILTQTAVMNNGKTPDSDDNWNVVI